MSNYDFVLDMVSDNSNSLILRNIKRESKVLEFGSSHGRMTKYLKEQLDCHVSIVEIDEVSGQVASQYADKCWLGNEVGNAESLHWYYELKKNRQEFDYIIFADVLEHLLYPDIVLKRAAEVLKKDGSILVSIPNISHNSVIIDLLQDKFEYREAGILDKTHLKFFTYNSLKQMIASAGLTVTKEINAINTVENSEFGNSYNQLPEQISEYLRSRVYGEVYQFVWELKKTNLEVSIIIPVFNKWAFTKSCLDDLVQLDQAKVEIIVIDNASTDDTLVNLSEYQKRYSNIVVIQNTENRGFGNACNIAYQQSKGDFIMFLNNDIRVKDNFRNWTDTVIQVCTDNNIVGPTGGKVDPDNDFQFLYETNDPLKEINYLSGWCITAKRTVWEKFIDPSLSVGPFNEEYFCYFEDTHLSFLAKEKGISLCMLSIPVVHFGKVSSKQLDTYKLYKASRALFVKNWKNSSCLFVNRS